VTLRPSLSLLCVGLAGAGIQLLAAPPAASTKEVVRLALQPNPLVMQGDFFARNCLKSPTMGPTPFSPERPANLKKEPAYKGKPLYGHLTLGNGAKRDYLVVLDNEAKAIYIDTNQNGDLTDDAPFAWANANKQEDGSMEFSGNFIFEVAFDLGKGKESRSPVCVNAGYYTGMDKFFARSFHARTGRVALKGKTYNAMVATMSASGVFVSDPAKVTGRGMETGLVFIDWDGDSTFAPWGHSEDYEMGKPVEFQGQWVKFDTNADGSLVTARTCTPPPEAKFKPQPEKQAGDKALDFTLQKPDGSTVRLSDYKGKVVVVDFWATWCGPCQAALPKVEELWKQVKGNPNVVFLGLCVADEKKAFDKWISEKGPNFSFTIGWDPAGKTREGKDQMYLWGVSGIPHTFVVDPSGTIIASISGGGPESEAKLAKALEAQGVKIP